MRQHGIDCMLYLLSSERFYKELEYKMINAITEALGRDIWTKSVIGSIATDYPINSDEYRRVTLVAELLLKFIATYWDNENQTSEQMANKMPFVVVPSQRETSSKGEKWLGLIHLAIFLTLYRHIKNNDSEDLQV